MDTESLNTFIWLCEYKNYTKTSEVLFVAQSTVTKRIVELEKEVGKQLFTRTKRSVTLTKEGEIFLEYAKRIVSMAKESVNEINFANRYQNKIRIGTTNTIYECYIASKIKEYMHNNPEDAVKITIGHSNDLIMGIQDKMYDIIYTYVPFSKSGYTCQVYEIDELVLVTKSDTNEYMNGIRKDELGESNYLYCNFALQDVGVFIKELFPPHFQFGFEIDNSTKLIPYLLEFGGISFLPESLAKPYIDEGVLRRIELIDFDTPKISCYRIQKL